MCFANFQDDFSSLPRYIFCININLLKKVLRQAYIDRPSGGGDTRAQSPKLKFCHGSSSWCWCKEQRLCVGFPNFSRKSLCNCVLRLEKRLHFLHGRPGRGEWRALHSRTAEVGGRTLSHGFPPSSWKVVRSKRFHCSPDTVMSSVGGCVDWRVGFCASHGHSSRPCNNHSSHCHRWATALANRVYVSTSFLRTVFNESACWVIISTLCVFPGFN